MVNINWFLIIIIKGLWDNVIWIDNNLTSLHISFQDEEKRSHTLQLTIPADYPSTPPICNKLFPEVVEINWSPSSSSIRSIIDQHVIAARKYKELWKQLDDIDQHCWVIEPEVPSFAISSRRISLGNMCSLYLEIV
jgi:hypothetical protein